MVRDDTRRSLKQKGQAMRNRKPPWIYRSDSHLYKLFNAILVTDIIGMVIGAAIAAAVFYSLAARIDPSPAARNLLPEKKQEQAKEEPLPNLIGETHWAQSVRMADN
jgi:hypothetical protein